MGIQIKTNKIKKFPALRVSGRIVNIDSEKFGKKLEKFVEKNDTNIIVDLSKTDFIDSFGLGMLIKYNSAAQAEGKKLIILNTNNKSQAYINRLFDVTGLEKILTIVKDKKELEYLPA